MKAALARFPQTPRKPQQRLVPASACGVSPQAVPGIKERGRLAHMTTSQTLVHPVPTDSTKAPDKSPLKSIWTTATSWFSNPPDPPVGKTTDAKQKSWQSGLENQDRDQ